MGARAVLGSAVMVLMTLIAGTQILLYMTEISYEDIKPEITVGSDFLLLNFTVKPSRFLNSSTKDAIFKNLDGIWDPVDVIKYREGESLRMGYFGSFRNTIWPNMSMTCTAKIKKL